MEMEFTQEEWDALKIKDLRMNHFVEVDGTYFKPAVSDAVKNLCFGMKRNKILTEVDLGGNHILPEGASYLADLLESNPPTQLTISS